MILATKIGGLNQNRDDSPLIEKTHVFNYYIQKKLRHEIKQQSG